jgi:hypothetical protein
MRRATWALAVLFDVLGIAMGLAHFIGEAPPLVWFWGAIQVAVFGALVTLLVRPRVIPKPAQFAKVARSLCFSLPAIALLGSLDLGIISGLEWFAIFIAALIGALNWVAFNANAMRPVQDAA